MKILTQIQAAKAKSEESTWRRNSRPKRALHRDVFCPVSRIPSVESTKCGVDAFAKRTTRMKLNNCHLFNEIKSHPKSSHVQSNSFFSILLIGRGPLVSNWYSTRKRTRPFSFHAHREGRRAGVDSAACTASTSAESPPTRRPCVHQFKKVG